MYWIALFENLSRVNGHLSQLMETLSMFLFPPSLSLLLFISLLYYNRIVFKLVIQAAEIYSNCKDRRMKVKWCQYLPVVSNWENIFDWCSGGRCWSCFNQLWSGREHHMFLRFIFPVVHAGSRRIPVGELGREIVGGGSHTDTPEVSLVVTPQWGQGRKSFFSFLRALKTL